MPFIGIVRAMIHDRHIGRARVLILERYTDPIQQWMLFLLDLEEKIVHTFWPWTRNKYKQQIRIMAEVDPDLAQEFFALLNSCK